MTRRRAAARPALVLAVALLAVVLIGTSTAHAATALTWTRTASAPSVKGPLALSCASSSLCVAVDAGGDALVSTDPGASAATWKLTTVSAGKDLTGVSCPSTGECVTVDSEGEIFATTAPTGTWTQVADEPGYELTSVSCGSTALCVAVATNGYAFHSSEPDVSGKWTGSDIDGANELTSVSCASASLCVAVDGSGNALATTKPTSEWPTPQPITPGDSPLLTVSCEASGACAATDEAGEVLIDTNPTATSSPDIASPYWSGPNLKAGALPALSCISGLCVTANAAGESFASEDLDALPAQWSASAVGKQSASASVEVVSCVPASICVALAAPATGEGPLESFSATVPSPPVETPPPPPKEAPPVVSLVTPSPKIAGTPAAGQTLTCEPGLPAGATATVTYQWLANTDAIAGATNPKYKVRSGDEGDHLQCGVTATDAAGSVEKTSSYVAIPLAKPPTSIGETTVSKATVAKNKVSFTVDCSTKAVGSCKIEAALTLYERLRGTKVIGLSASKPAHVKEVKHAKDAAAHTAATSTSSKEAASKSETSKGTTTESSEQLKVGSLKLEVKPGHTRTVTLQLNAAGKKLAGERKRLPTTFTVSGTVIGVLTGELRSQTLSLKGTTKTTKTKKAKATKAKVKAKAGRQR